MVARKDNGAAPPPGGGFLLEDCGARPIFTPEDFDDSARELGRLADRFVRQEVVPQVKAMEIKEPGVMVGALKKAGALGLLAIDVPERYGGADLPKTVSMLVTEQVGRVGSFAVTAGAHTGIGTLPLVFYGDEAQKRRYLPGLASGELVAAYALTEAGSGSDALAARASATALPDGSWRLRGVKQWITNAAFADLFTVFAQADGDKFSAFLVERGWPGVSVGPEEHKMGIRGSSTCELILEDVVVPAGAVLGKIGRGHKIAFNILNVGRLKLGIGTIGAAKYALELAATYAPQRKQFGRPISEFGLIRQKLGRMAVAIFAGESMGYRTADLIDQAARAGAGADDDAGRGAAAIEEFAIEASILKVYGSEVLDWVADEALQIHGGYGFTEEYPIERIARDARINRIFEGTNEINRLLIPGMLFRRALAGRLDLARYAKKSRKRLAEDAPFSARAAGAPLEHERRVADLAKRVLAYLAALAVEKYGPGVQEHQEVLGALADTISDAYALDSCVTRTLQAIDRSSRERAATYERMTRVFAHDAHLRILDTARLLAAQMLEGQALEEAYATIAKIPEPPPLAYFSAVDAVAARVLEAGGYPAIG